MRLYPFFLQFAVCVAAAALSFCAMVAVAGPAPDEEPDPAALSRALYGDDFTIHSNINSDATTDDHSSAVPTGWWVYTNVDAAYVSSRLSANSARLTDLDVHSIVSGAPRFTVRMVPNSGAYAVPGWWWYYGLTFADVGSYLTANGARLIDLEPYDAGGGVIRYAAVMVSNTGAAARSWGWLAGVTSTQISQHLTRNGDRLMDLDTYVEGGVKKYTAIFIANTGADAKTWQWWINQSSADVASKLSTFHGRMVNLERQSSGLYNVIMVKNDSPDAAAWWWGPAFSSITDVVNFASQLGARPIDLQPYVASGVRKYAAVFLENSNAATRHVRDVYATSFLDGNGAPTRGIFEAYLKRVGSSVVVDLNSARRGEVASSIKALHLLHTLRTGDDVLGSFVYYNYPSTVGSGLAKDACPNPADETAANRKTDYNLETGLQQMMAISDNRTTRGVVLRYGLPAINATAAGPAGMPNTVVRHNVGCAYYNLATGKYDTGKRNDTTSADLAHLYEGVWNTATVTSSQRTEYLKLANPGSGASSALQTIINQEAASLGKSASVASSFGSLVRTWSKGGSYGTCLPDAGGGCGQKVIIQSGAGIIRFPVQGRGGQTYRTYVFGRFISDVPVSDWSGADATNYINTYSNAANELYRAEVRSALTTW